MRFRLVRPLVRRFDTSRVRLDQRLILAFAVVALVATAAIAQQAGKNEPSDENRARSNQLKILTKQAAVLAGEIGKSRASSNALRRVAEDRRLDIETAKARHNQANLDSEISKTAIVEYEQGELLQELDIVQGEAALADAELERADAELKEIDRVEKVFKDEQAATELAIATARLNLKRSRFSAEAMKKAAEFRKEQAKVKRKVLTEYTKPRKLGELRSGIARASARELEARAAWELAKVVSAKAEAEAVRSATTPAEKKAIRLLNEVYVAVDKTRKELASPTPGDVQPLLLEIETKIEEAGRLWADEQDLRAEAKFRAGD